MEVIGCEFTLQAVSQEIYSRYGKSGGGQDESIDFKRVMDIYLVNPSSRPYTIERNEYLLSGGASRKKRNGDGHENYRGGAGFDTYP